MSTDEQAIRDLIATWMRESLAGNQDAVLPLMAEDVVFLGPGRPAIRGRAEFAAMAKSAAKGTKLEGNVEIQEVDVSGHLAYVVSRIRISVTPPDGPAVTRSGPVLTVFRKNDAGSWELLRDANMQTVEG
jgi:uncharacterized protein (TIGR02246 family)